MFNPDLRMEGLPLFMPSPLFKYPFIYIALVSLFSGIAYGQGPTTCGLSRQYAISAAQFANQSYGSAEQARFTASPAIANRHVDTAVYYIQQSALAMDSAIFFASDTDKVALRYAGISKEYATNAFANLVAAARSKVFSQKIAFAEEATFLSAHATVDAYHASFYFTDSCPPVLEKPPIDKVALVEQLLDQAGFDYNLLDIQVTKLDVDQTLFSLLMIQLTENTTQNAAEIEKLSAMLKTEKNLVKAAKLKEQLRKLEEKEKEYTARSKEVFEKLGEINTQIAGRDKAKAPTVSEATVFSKPTNKIPDHWNKQVMMDVEMPEGLFYQVQIGVYKNVISAQNFKGLTPLYGKTVPAGISYATGMFEKLEDATQAKIYVRSMGLTDAFVTAFYNKKQISVTEAQKLEKK